jgi:hypothetical protein
MTDAPFFIVGCGRSGTTLLRRMLNHHPQIAIPVESLFIIDYLRAADNLPLPDLKALMLGEFELHRWQVEVTASDLRDCPDVVSTINRLHQRYTEQNHKTVWGQKTPRFIRYGHLLKQHYPQSRFIHVIRDPRAVANSLRNSNVHRSNVYFGAQRWLKDVRHGLRLQDDYPDTVLNVFYEQLVAEPQATLQQVCEFLHLPYEAQMLEYHQTSGAEYGGYHARIHRRVNQKPTTDRINAWRNELNPLEVQVIEDIARPLMQSLGYEPDNHSFEVPEGYLRNLKLERLFRGIPYQLWQYTRGRTYHLFYSIWRKFRLRLLWEDVRQVNY